MGEAEKAADAAGEQAQRIIHAAYDRAEAVRADAARAAAAPSASVVLLGDVDEHGRQIVAAAETHARAIEAEGREEARKLIADTHEKALAGILATYTPSKTAQ